MGRRLVALAALPAVRATFGPVIGVLTEPLDSDYPGSYLEDWYVRWVESQGARVVPLRYDAPEQEIDALLKRVNGLVFPGGGAAIEPSSKYGSFGLKVFNAAVQDRIPTWGTCLGFEMLMLYSSGLAGEGPLTGGWDAEKLELPLLLTDAGKASALVADWPDELLRAVASNNVTWHFHQSSVAIADFEKNEVLTNFWSLVATNKDRRGMEFVSVAEGKNLPFFVSQFHPEKNANEFEQPDEGGVPGHDSVHSESAVDMANLFARHFVGRARSFRDFGFTQEEFWNASIRAWPVHNAGQVKGLEDLPTHMQVYYFPPFKATESSEAEVLV